MFIYSSALPMSWSFNLSSTKKLQSLIWIETSVGVKYVALNDRAQKRKSNVSSYCARLNPRGDCVDSIFLICPDMIFLEV